MHTPRTLAMGTAVGIATHKDAVHEVGEAVLNWEPIAEPVDRMARTPRPIMDKAIVSHEETATSTLPSIQLWLCGLPMPQTRNIFPT